MINHPSQQRNFYLDKLIINRHNGLIKIVTGLRRSGKTFLLFNLFYKYLRKNGVPDSHIIRVALDDIANESLRRKGNMLTFLDSKIGKKGIYYVLLDEVQMLESFVGILNHLLYLDNVDVYVTGSNSRFLSRDVATEFRGRGLEIHILPFSFSEYFSAVGGDRSKAWDEYCHYGGLPQLLAFDDNDTKKEFLKSLIKTVYLRDLIERKTIKNEEEFQELLNFIASSIGSPCNPTKLANTFKSIKNVSIDPKTIARYLSHIEDAFIVEKALRFDIKGKKHIGTLSKYYFQDIGLRNALIDFRQFEESHIMENVIYNELRNRGYHVDVGQIESWGKENDTSIRKVLEVDFVAERGSLRFYIQSALSIDSDEKRIQETASFKKIDDSFKRILIVKTSMLPYYDNDGFFHLGLFDFLLKTEQEWGL